MVTLLTIMLVAPLSLPDFFWYPESTVIVVMPVGNGWGGQFVLADAGEVLAAAVVAGWPKAAAMHIVTASIADLRVINASGYALLRSAPHA